MAAIARRKAELRQLRGENARLRAEVAKLRGQLTKARQAAKTPASGTGAFRPGAG